MYRIKKLSMKMRVTGALAVVAMPLLLATEAWGAFTGGPSVRVSPNTNVEIRWNANFVGDGRVEIFDNPNGGVPIDVKTSSAATGHTIVFTVGGVLQADTTYFFRVIHRDPTNVLPDLTNDPAPYPSFFTGAQAIGDVFVFPTADGAVIQWDANVIGKGRVDYGIASPDEFSVEDLVNGASHNIELTGLAPGTTYQFRVRNRHAIDGDSLAAQTGSFSTLPSGCSGTCFASGPSVRVTPNDQVEFTWTTDVSWFGDVAVFNNPDGIGTPVFVKQDEDAGGSPIASTQHTVTMDVAAPLSANTTYFFKVTATDPNGSLPSFFTPRPLRPFFTGAQAIGDVFVDANVDRAVIQWDANVIGKGRVDYGIASPDEFSVEDSVNGASHNIELTGLAPGTTYQFRVRNRHAIDGDSLAETTGLFTTGYPGGSFTSGPSVQVIPTGQVEFTWTTDIPWFGEVAVFNNCNGTGTPLVLKQAQDALGNPIASTQHTVVINVGAGAPLAVNANYCFKVTATDPLGNSPAFSTPPNLLFFTAAQGSGPSGFRPSVRVIHNIPPFDSTRVEIRWITNFIGDGRVWIFDNPTGGLIIDGGFDGQWAGARINLSVGGVLRPDTTYFFRATHIDPTNSLPDLTNDPAPYPSFFTGAQAIGDVRVVADTNNAIISWDANVIGLGRVEYASSSPGDAHVVDDRNNLPDHSMALTGLQPGTTYEYRVCNRHAFDGDCLAEETGSFTTPLGSSGPSVGCDSNALIAAIDSANDASGDIIELSPGCTYTLNQPSISGAPDQMPVGLPAITGAIVIRGNGATITRGGLNPPPFRILQVDSTGTLVLDHLTVSGGELLLGSSGGGILNNRGTLRITHSTISGNAAYNSGGAIVNSNGELTIDQSNISGNHASLGGGIANEAGNARITQSTISDNDAPILGGGIFNTGTVTVTQSTISGNESTNSGADYGGAAIYNELHGELSVVQSTISGNVSQSRGGGIYNRGGTVAVTQSTIFGNEAAASAGGIYDNGFASGIVNLSQSIIAGNLPGNCPSTPDITDGGYNLEDGTGCGFSQATSLSNRDPVLGPLQDNGGPTFTHALLPGSPAIDKGISNGSDTDQRGPGFPRIWDDPNIPNAPGGDGADIGAFEAFDTTPPSITPTVSGTLGNNDWYTSDVTVSWSVVDSGSTVTSQSGCDSQTISTDTNGITLTCTATSAGGTSSQSVTIKRDATAPTLAPTVSPNPVTLNGAATATPNASDSPSGVASQSCAAVDTSSVGSYSVVCTATDNAGNTANANADYQVSYNFVGFFQPVDNLPTLNLATAGAALPVKFSLTGYQGLAIFAPGYPASNPIQCDASDPGAVIDETVNAGSSSLNYTVTSDQYSYIWKTNKAWKGTCRILVLKLDDNSQHQAKFKFR